MEMQPEIHAHHRWLHQLLGEWTYEGEALMGMGSPAEKSVGTEHVRALGAAWVLGEGSGTMPGGGVAQTMMTLGFDPKKDVFVGTWVGSMMTHMWIYRGTLDADQKVLTLETEGPSFSEDGGTAHYRDVITILGPKERTLASFIQQPDGAWESIMKTSYRRKQAA